MLSNSFLYTQEFGQKEIQTLSGSKYHTHLKATIKICTICINIFKNIYAIIPTISKNKNKNFAK